MKAVYAACAVLGTILPYSQFVPWLADHGLNLGTVMRAVVSDRISAFAWLDVLVSAAVLLAFIRAEGCRLGMRALWLPVVATLAIGVSCGLPLFLLMREHRLAAGAPTA